MPESEQIKITGNENPERTLVDFFYIFLDKFWIILILLVGGLIYAQHKISKIPTTYESRATIEILGETEAVADLAQNKGNQRLRYIVDPVTTVVQKLNLEGLYLKAAQSDEIQALRDRMIPGGTSSEDGTPPPGTAQNQDMVNRRLAKAMNSWTKVTVRPKSPLVDIRCEHTDPQVAREVIAAMLREYSELGSNKRIDESAANLKLLEEQIESIRANLSKSEQSLVIYKRALEIISEIRDSERKIREMEKVYLPKWPALVQEKLNFDSLRLAFIKELNRIVSGSQTETKFWATELQKAGGLEGEAVDSFRFQTVEARNNMLRRDFESESDLYESLLAKMRMGSVESEFKPSEITILEPPTLPVRPQRINKMGMFARYGILGLGAGAILALALGMLDSSVRKVEDLERISGYNVLAAIPKSGKLSKGLCTENDTREKESFRTLFTNTILGVPNAATIMVTSSIPGEGKSTVSCNLAATSASWGWGHEVLIIDLDLRRPRVDQYLGMEPNQQGVGDHLLANVDIASCIHRHKDVKNLSVMPAGVMRFQGKLPHADSLEAMLDKLKGTFKTIVIDSAPILAVSDTLLLAQAVDEVCLVFRMWKTPRGALVRAANLLEQNNIKPFGVVANSMPNRKSFGQYGYYYSYSGSGYESYSQ